MEQVDRSVTDGIPHMFGIQEMYVRSAPIFCLFPRSFTKQVDGNKYNMQFYKIQAK